MLIGASGLCFEILSFWAQRKMTKFRNLGAKRREVGSVATRFKREARAYVRDKINIRIMIYGY